jgi:hypothetical protein
LVATIDELFSIDAQARDQNLSVSERDQLRQQKARAIPESIKSQIEAGKGQSLPKSALAKACNYTLTFWPRLTRFLDPLRQPGSRTAHRSYPLHRGNLPSLADPHPRLSQGYLVRPSRLPVSRVAELTPTAWAARS